MNELNRKFVHISVLLFVILAQFTGRWVAAFYFLFIAAVFIIYSEHIRRERLRLRGLIRRIEKDFRKVALSLERKEAPLPFIGAFWLFFGCGAAFVILPMTVASAACAMVAVGDGLSTLVGRRWGRSKVVGSKSWEGTVAMFVACLFVGTFFVNQFVSVVGAITATVVELLPETGPLRKHKSIGVVDDNFLVPMAAGVLMLVASVF
jgi:dolichol kinase